MEGYSYVSCIKINGVPIIPPMMTKDIKEEMIYYKQLAIGVEKRLIASRNAKRLSSESSLEINKLSRHTQLRKEACSLDSDLINSKCESIDLESESPNVTTIISLETESFEKNSVSNFEENAQWNSNSDEENDMRLVPSNVSRSESLSASVDSNYCLNETTSTKSNTADTTPEIWKPQVPKTLNIIPLTLDNPNQRSEEQYSGDSLNNFEETPKLVRQGSYVLDTPSPMLLAHIQSELSNTDRTPSLEYIPTTTTNTVRRKEWNIAQAKIEWKHQLKFKEMIPSDSSRNLSRPLKNGQIDANQKIRKSHSLQGKSKASMRSYTSTRSVDCIQAMLAKEYIARSNAKRDHNQKNNNETNRETRSEKWHKYKSFSITHLDGKLGGSLGNLNNNGSIEGSLGNLINVGSIEGECADKSPSDHKEDTLKNKEIQVSTFKLKSSITSDKLLNVYKEIQEMHKKQMTELVDRQQREQSLLQQEFEKQQLLLLTEIKKSFPEIPISLLSESITSPASNKSLPNNEKLVEIDGIDTRPQEDIMTRSTPCPLDYICPGVDFCSKVQCPANCSQLTQTLAAESPVKTDSSKKQNKPESQSESRKNSKLKEASERVGLNVSRQLFPLASKTTHVPVIDNSVYESKHIRAVNLINAHVRGYLVRRTMETERVIALKNTYKEALHCMLKLHVDAPLNRSEYNFLHRLQLQCDAASMNIVELFTQSSKKRMQVIAQDREIKRARAERPTSARSYSFATQRTLARKKLKEMGDYRPPSLSRTSTSRSRCKTWTSDMKEKLFSPNVLNQSIKRSTSAGTVRKPWR